MSEAVAITSPIPCRPFLKWAGGKSQLLEHLLRLVPQYSGRYFEPFLGGAALFFTLQPQSAVLSDLNGELINTYQAVKESAEELIQELSAHRYESEYYYKIRDLDRADDFARQSKVVRASRFIFLNKTCFNGLYRVNASGHFNVPFGRYTNPTIADAPNLFACSAALQTADIRACGFQHSVESARSGDFVYFDPPYVPLSDTANFTGYSAAGFSHEQQTNLRDTFAALAQRGVAVMLSNSDTPIVRELYADFKIHAVQATRAINSKASRRGKISELIITSY